MECAGCCPLVTSRVPGALSGSRAILALISVARIHRRPRWYPRVSCMLIIAWTTLLGLDEDHLEWLAEQI